MNILLVNWQDRENPQAGGAEVELFEIYSRLAARGHRVRLVCSGWDGATPRATIGGIEVHRTGGRRSFLLRGRGAVRAALRAERPDIVVEDINKVPLYLPTLTDLPLCAMVPHLFGGIAFLEVSAPAAAFVWLAERPIPRIYRRAGFHAVSESTRDDLIARGVDPRQIRVIHPGVDVARLAPDPAVARSVQPSFLYLGRLKRYKGLEVAIRALARARVRRPDLRLDLAGTGDDRARLEGITRSLDQAGAVRFHGYVDEATKLRLFRTAWANLLPSAKEGWGITIVEAAACGTPSLASDSPGLRDSVRHGETGFLVPHGDVDALAERMVALATDPGLVARLGAAARRLAEGLTWARSAEQTESHLHEIISGVRP